MGCSPWGREESDTTEQLPFHFSLSSIGEGNGNPLLCSCLENPRDGGVYGVTQSLTRLKSLSSSSSSRDSSTSLPLAGTISYSIGKFTVKKEGMHAKSLQSCPTVCDPIDGSPPAPPSLGFSKQEHWSGLPFPSPMDESGK